MSDLRRAIEIAYGAHCGQLDKSGQPYIDHPLRVMHSLPDDPPELQIIGVLHDVVEDNPGWTLDRLRSEGFSHEVVSGVDAVTRRKAQGETYRNYIRRCAPHPFGRIVKLHDLADNLGRLDHLGAEGAGLGRRYRAAREHLLVPQVLRAVLSHDGKSWTASCLEWRLSIESTERNHLFGALDRQAAAIIASLRTVPGIEPGPLIGEGLYWRAYASGSEVGFTGCRQWTFPLEDEPHGEETPILTVVTPRIEIRQEAP